AGTNSIAIAMDADHLLRRSSACRRIEPNQRERILFVFEFGSDGRQDHVFAENRSLEQTVTPKRPHRRTRRDIEAEQVTVALHDQHRASKAVQPFQFTEWP